MDLAPEECVTEQYKEKLGILETILEKIIREQSQHFKGRKFVLNLISLPIEMKVEEAINTHSLGTQKILQKNQF